MNSAKMLSRALFSFVLMTSFFYYPSIVLADGNSNQNDLCDELSGKAKGICKAAMAIGCDGYEKSSTTQCVSLLIQYEEETGTLPPWPVCPCYDVKTLNDLYQLYPSTCKATECNDDFNPSSAEYTRTEWLNEEYLCSMTQVAVWNWTDQEKMYIECHISGMGSSITLKIAKDEALACSNAIKKSIIWKKCP